MASVFGSNPLGCISTASIFNEHVKINEKEY